MHFGKTKITKKHLLDSLSLFDFPAVHIIMVQTWIMLAKACSLQCSSNNNNNDDKTLIGCIWKKTATDTGGLIIIIIFKLLDLVLVALDFFLQKIYLFLVVIDFFLVVFPQSCQLFPLLLPEGHSRRHTGQLTLTKGLEATRSLPAQPGPCPPARRSGVPHPRRRHPDTFLEEGGLGSG